MAKRESFLNMLPTGIREPLRKMFAQTSLELQPSILLETAVATGISINAAITRGIWFGDSFAATDGILLAGSVTDAIRITATCADNGIEISGTISGAAIMLRTTNKIAFYNDNTYIHSSAEGTLLLASSGSAASAIYLTNNVQIGGNLRLGSTNKIEFRNASHYIHSDTTGRLMFVSPGTSTTDFYFDGTTYFQGGSTFAGGYARIHKTSRLEFRDAGLYIESDIDGRMMFSSDGTGETDFYFAGTTYFNGGSKITGGNLMMNNDARIQFRDSAIYMHSSIDGRLWIASDTTIYLDSEVWVTGALSMSGGYFRLWRTDVDGTLEGQLWYDDSENKLKYYNGTQVKTLAQE